MSDSFGIEKYQGSFEQDDLGVTQIPTETIKSITNMTDLALFTFLASCAKNWRLNAKHLAAHFDCNKEKIYKSIDSLIAKGFLSRVRLREKGKFSKYHYKLHLRQIQVVDIDQQKPVEKPQELPQSQASTDFKPCLEKPDTVKPELENPDTYKTKSLQSKEDIKNPYVDFDKSTSYKDDDLFMQFYSIYPNKQKPDIARKAFYKHKPTQEFVLMIRTDVLTRVENNWKHRHKSKIPFPATYLNTKEWEGEIYKDEPQRMSKPKYKTFDEIRGSYETDC